MGLAAVEMLPGDQDVAPRVSRLFRRMQDLYAAAIIRAQTLGEIDPELDERVLARFLVCQIQGMRVLGKAGADRAETAAMIDLALKALDKGGGSNIKTRFSGKSEADTPA